MITIKSINEELEEKFEDLLLDKAGLKDVKRFIRQKIKQIISECPDQCNEEECFILANCVKQWKTKYGVKL